MPSPPKTRARSTARKLVVGGAPVAELGLTWVLGDLVGGHEELEIEPCRELHELRQRGVRGRVGQVGGHGDAAQGLRHRWAPGRQPSARRRRLRAVDCVDRAPGGIGGAHAIPWSAAVGEVDEVLNVALRSGVSRVGHAEHRGAALLEPSADAREHFNVHGLVAHDAPLADMVTAGLELRFDEHEPSVAGAQAF